MAFNLERFGKTSVTAARAPLIWTYDAAGDSLSDCAQPGYFNGNRPNLSSGHLIYVNSGADYSILRITSASPDVVTEVIFPSPKTIVSHGIADITNANGSTFNISVPGAKTTDTAFVQIHADVITSVQRVYAYADNVFFSLSDAVNGNFSVNYLVMR